MRVFTRSMLALAVATVGALVVTAAPAHADTTRDSIVVAVVRRLRQVRVEDGRRHRVPVGPRRMGAVLQDVRGHPTVAIDVDQLYFNVDARWELLYDDDRNAMVLDQATGLAISLFEHGWPTVMITGNSLFDPADTAPILATLGPIARVYHVTLTPDPATILRRCATTPGRDASRPAAEADLLARKPHPGSGRMDNTTLTPEQTLTEIARLVDAGVGRVPHVA
jgi:hypothetical protein